MDSGHLFSVDPLEHNAARGHGSITSMAFGKDVIVLGTSKGWIIRHDFGLCDSFDPKPNPNSHPLLIFHFSMFNFLDMMIAYLDFSGGRGDDQLVHHVFLDSGRSHCIANVLHSDGAETYYTHTKWAKPRVLTRLKGLVVNAVA